METVDRGLTRAEIIKCHIDMEELFKDVRQLYERSQEVAKYETYYRNGFSTLLPIPVDKVAEQVFNYGIDGAELVCNYDEEQMKRHLQASYWADISKAALVDVVPKPVVKEDSVHAFLDQISAKFSWLKGAVSIVERAVDEVEEVEDTYIEEVETLVEDSAVVELAEKVEAGMKSNTALSSLEEKLESIENEVLSEAANVEDALQSKINENPLLKEAEELLGLSAESSALRKIPTPRKDELAHFVYVNYQELKELGFIGQNLYRLREKGLEVGQYGHICNFKKLLDAMTVAKRRWVIVLDDAEYLTYCYEIVSISDVEGGARKGLLPLVVFRAMDIMGTLNVLSDMAELRGWCWNLPRWDFTEADTSDELGLSALKISDSCFCVRKDVTLRAGNMTLKPANPGYKGKGSWKKIYRWDEYGKDELQKFFKLEEDLPEGKAPVDSCLGVLALLKSKYRIGVAISIEWSEKDGAMSTEAARACLYSSNLDDRKADNLKRKERWALNVDLGFANGAKCYTNCEILYNELAQWE